MNFRMILIITIKHLTCKPQLLRLFFIPRPHQYFKSCQLKLSQLKLSHIHTNTSFSSLMISLNISSIIHHLLYLYLIFVSFHLFIYLLSWSQLICIMDINEMGFYIMWNCLVMGWLPESCLTSCTEEIFCCMQEWKHLIFLLFYILIEGYLPLFAQKNDFYLFGRKSTYGKWYCTFYFRNI